MLKEISIEVIRKCPNNCIHCSSLSSQGCREMISIDKLMEVVDGAKALGLKTVCFSGGEPFLHPDIVGMVDYVYSKGLNSYIYSSGVCLDHAGNKTPIPETILDKISGKVTKIIFNIEAADEHIYDSIMGTKGSFYLLEQSIKRAVTRKIIVEGHFVPMKLNKSQIEPVIELCEGLGVSKISFLRLVIHGRAKDNVDRLMLSEEELKEVQERLQRLYKRKPSYIRIGVPLQEETKEINCEAANGKLNIRYDGNVYPCEVFKNNSIEILGEMMPGNIFKEKIEKIYKDSEYLRKVRTLIAQFSCGNCCENCIGQYYMKLDK